MECRSDESFLNSTLQWAKAKGGGHPSQSELKMAAPIDCLTDFFVVVSFNCFFKNVDFGICGESQNQAPADTETQLYFRVLATTIPRITSAWLCKYCILANSVVKNQLQVIPGVVGRVNSVCGTHYLRQLRVSVVFIMSNPCPPGIWLRPPRVFSSNFIGSV